MPSFPPQEEEEVGTPARLEEVEGEGWLVELLETS